MAGHHPDGEPCKVCLKGEVGLDIIIHGCLRAEIGIIDYSGRDAEGSQVPGKLSMDRELLAARVGSI